MTGLPPAGWRRYCTSTARRREQGGPACVETGLLFSMNTLITEAHNQLSPRGGHVSNPALLIVGGVRRDQCCTIIQFYIPSPQVPLSPKIYHSKVKKDIRPHMKYHKWHSGKSFILQVTTKSCRAPQRANSCLKSLICRWLLRYSYVCVHRFWGLLPAPSAPHLKILPWFKVLPTCLKSPSHRKYSFTIVLHSSLLGSIWRQSYDS